jgi:hypothetical protein
LIPGVNVWTNIFANFEHKLMYKFHKNLFRAFEETII